MILLKQADKLIGFELTNTCCLCNVPVEKLLGVSVGMRG